MRKTEDGGLTFLAADNGKMLTNGVTFAGMVCLGANDREENWRDATALEYEEWLADAERMRAEEAGLEYVPPEPVAETPPPVDLDALERARAGRRVDILRHDRSGAVNVFYLNGAPMWVPRDERAALRNRVLSETAAGVTHTTLWNGTDGTLMPVAEAAALLDALEVYAAQCYDTTRRHLAAVGAMETEEEVNGFDFTDGYPTPPAFIV